MRLVKILGNMAVALTALFGFVSISVFIVLGTWTTGVIVVSLFEDSRVKVNRVCTGLDEIAKIQCDMDNGVRHESPDGDPAAFDQPGVF